MQRFELRAFGSHQRAFFNYVSQPAQARIRTKALLLIIALALLPIAALARSLAVSGSVSGSTGRPITSATIELTQENGAIRTRTSTNAEGIFQLPIASVGAYRLGRASCRDNA